MKLIVAWACVSVVLVVAYYIVKPPPRPYMTVKPRNSTKPVRIPTNFTAVAGPDRWYLHTVGYDCVVRDTRSNAWIFYGSNGWTRGYCEAALFGQSNGPTTDAYIEQLLKEVPLILDETIYQVKNAGGSIDDVYPKLTTEVHKAIHTNKDKFFGTNRSF